MKTWNEMTEAEREAFKLTKDYLDPTNPARVPWVEWSDAAVGAVFFAHRKGKPVQTLLNYSWGEVSPVWVDYAIYRLPPEPKREIVRLSGEFGAGSWVFGKYRQEGDIYTISFPTLDGKPVLDKCPHCGTAPIDMDEL